MTSRDEFSRGFNAYFRMEPFSVYQPLRWQRGWLAAKALVESRS